jgi:hypothetical protein
MLAYLTQDGQIDYAIVHKLDRLARNRADDVEINRAFTEYATDCWTLSTRTHNLTAHACTPLPHTSQENDTNHHNHTTQHKTSDNQNTHSRNARGQDTHGQSNRGQGTHGHNAHSQ